MKKFLYSFMMFFAAVSFAACGGEEDGPETPDTPTQEPEVIISVSEKTMKGLVADGLETSITFDAPDNWRTKSTADWIIATPTQGTKGSATVKVTIEQNTSTEQREGEMIVETISTNKTFYKLTVTQKGREVVVIPDENSAAPDGMHLNAAALVKKIAVGWNLGNTFEATDEWIDDKGVVHGNSQYVEGGANLYTETSWGNPATTREMMVALKAAGFNGVRIPVRWYRHADASMNINAEWMARVKEVVQWAVDEGMYVILNSHHDNWYDRMLPSPDAEGIKAKFSNMWTQIAKEFNGFDEHLIFAAVNEVIIDSNGPWMKDGELWPWLQGTTIQNGPTEAHQKLFDELMQIFVDDVRATGGNNAWRNLMIQPWAASIEVATSGTANLPKDKVEHRLIFEFHCYTPYDYCTAKSKHEPVKSDYDNIRRMFQKLNEHFVEAGVPCIMAEFGATQDNSDEKKNDTFDKTRAEYHKFVVSEAKKYNIPGFYWDNNAFGGNGETFGLFDRATCTFSDRAKVALQGIMDGLK